MQVYVHVTDGRGLYAGMKLVEASSEQEAIERTKAEWKDIPRCCTQWFASTEKKYINSVKRMGRKGEGQYA